MTLDAMDVARKNGSEPFHTAGTGLGFDLLSFRQWSCSDLCSNLLRGMLAEYLVARAVGKAGGVRNEWDAHDVTTSSGIKVEVKASAYIQTWAQEKLSKIGFDIGRKRGGDAGQDTWPGPPTRFADVYVFALLAHQDKATIDPVDVSQWEFYVLPTAVLDERCAAQKRISLSSLMKLGPVKVGFEERFLRPCSCTSFSGSWVTAMRLYLHHPGDAGPGGRERPAALSPMTHRVGAGCPAQGAGTTLVFGMRRRACLHP